MRLLKPVFIFESGLQAFLVHLHGVITVYKVSGNYKLGIILALYFAVAIPNLAPLIRRNRSITSTTFP
jgi:hypothetical protein